MHFKKVIHKGTLSLLVALYANGFTLPAQSVIEPSKVVDFPTALERALQNDPYQKWVDHRIEGIQGDHLQASKRPNPVIGIEIGNLLGSGSYRRTESSEVTLSLSQVIETAGKRNLRVQQAAASQNELLWERAHQRLQKEAQVRAAFIEARIAQDTLKLRHQQLKVAQASAQETARLANEARVPSVDAQSAELHAFQQEFQLEGAKRALQASQLALATHWNEHPETDFVLVGKIQIDPKIPSFDTLANALPQNLELQHYALRKETETAALHLERAQGIPDLQLFCGARYLNEESGEHAFVVGLEMEWPLFNKNKGNIQRAQANVHALESQRTLQQRILFRQLSSTYQNLAAAHNELNTIQNKLIPAAQKILEATELGYQNGRFTYLQLLERKNALFQLEEAQLDALKRYNLAQGKIETLIHPALKP